MYARATVSAGVPLAVHTHGFHGLFAPARADCINSDNEVLKAQRYLEENLSKGITIDEVAHHVCISPHHFKRRFKHATGHAPIHYLQMVRIEAAKKRLVTTMDTIEEITQYIGYEDSSTFRRLFKNHTQLS